jgi:gamma-glutamyltranspeptidase/glutathione hydrolase
MFETSRLERVGYVARRSVVMARNGMVASSQPLAVAGVSILKKGGNAIDAAIMTALTLGVVEPVSTGTAGTPFSSISQRRMAAYTGSTAAGAAQAA